MSDTRSRAKLGIGGPASTSQSGARAAPQATATIPPQAAGRGDPALASIVGPVCQEFGIGADGAADLEAFARRLLGGTPRRSR